MQSRIKDIALAFLNLLYPAKCPVCGGVTDNYSVSPICLECWSKVVPYKGNSCSICGRLLDSTQTNICMECLREPPVFKRLLFYGLYEGALREAIRLLKFSSIKRLARPLGELLAGLELPEADLIVPVPLEKSSLKERGFNQTLLIADALSKNCGVPVGTGLLFKIRKTPPQVGLPRQERLKNLRGAFKAKDLKGKRVILIDDVITTGTTCTECSKALYRAGAKEVYVVVLATPPPGGSPPSQ